ncbi:MAG TPA: AsmA family protein, partial [Longimicrobiaceae bacterium]|nr:AsmA family protein [Longimicrobiaceae bacterium]
MIRRYRFASLAAPLLAIPLLAVLLVIGVVLSLDAERIGALAAARAEAALGREVQVARARLQLWPVPAVALEEVTVSGPRAAEAGAPRAGTAAPMAAVQRIELRPRILPLLRGQVVVNALVLKRPRLLVEVDAAGATNLPALEDSEPQGGGTADFELRRLYVHDGRIAYRDARDGTVVRLDGIEQRLALKDATRAQSDVLRLDGTLRIAGLHAALPGRLARPVRELPIRVDHRAEWDRTADRLRIDQLRAQVQDFAFEGEGEVAHISDAAARTVALQLEASSFDLGQLVRSLPENLRRLPGDAAAAPITASGRARLQARVAGRLGGGATPELRGTLALDGVSLSQQRLGALASGVRGDVAFSLESVASTGLTGRLLDQPLHVAFEIHDPAAPRATIAVRTKLDLDRIGRLGLLPEGLRGEGVAALDVQAAGPLLTPEEMQLNGRIGVSGVRLAAEALQQPLHVRDGW